jgi:hypothetical protein
MDNRTKENLGDLLTLSPDEILMQIGILSEPSEGLTAPDELIRRAQTLIRSIKPTLAKQCCGLLRSFAGPELDLACAITALIVKDYQPILASALAAYVIKRGYIWLCEDKKDDR